jgi:hypothetical protein
MQSEESQPLHAVPKKSPSGFQGRCDLTFQGLGFGWICAGLVVLASYVSQEEHPLKANHICLTLIAVFLGLSGSAFAQKFEVDPYAGGFFPGDYRNEYKLRNEGVYGVKAGGHISDRVLLEGNWGWMPHMEFKGTDPRVRGMIWEFTPSFNFVTPRFGRAVPYVTVGVGGVTGFVGDTPNTTDRDLVFQFRGENDTAVDAGDLLFNAETKHPDTPARSLVLEDGDTFFAVSYGGGVKALNLWGPVGLRGDFRGRSMPNFFGNSISWMEVTGGLTFSWGER